ncbi:MAG: hypothetical protein WC858_04510 [Parcubacteria group bacterium]|jgi:hypothetical protein
MKKIGIINLAVVLLLAGFFCGWSRQQAQAALLTNASADVVIGQQNMTSNSPNQGNIALPGANTFWGSREVTMAGDKLIAIDIENNRVLIFNSIPTSDNASADVVIGQSSMSGQDVNQGLSADANTLNYATGVFYDGSKLFIADGMNNRVLIYNSIPTSNNVRADVVVGQPNFTSSSANQGVVAGANTLNQPNTMFSDGKKLFISDWGNNRVLVFNSIPTSNNANADFVIGQADLAGNAPNQGGSAAANTIFGPSYIFSNGKNLVIADRDNNRVLIYNSVPTQSNASANVVVGQANMNANEANRSGAVGANTLSAPRIVYLYGQKLLIADSDNNRLLIYNSIPTSNDANADTVVGQPDLTSNSPNQGGSVKANTFSYSPRGIFISKGKLILGDYANSRLLVYNSFGSQWTIGRNHSKTLSGGEKIKVKKKKLEFSGKKTTYKKGYVRIYRNGVLAKKVKIKKSGKWSASFRDTGSAVKDFVIKYYNSHNTLQMNSETYTLGINRGGLNAATLEKANYTGPAENSVGENKSSPQKDWDFAGAKKNAR